MATIPIPDYYTVIYVVITVIIAIKIILKYFKYKERNLLLVGIAWIGLAAVYFPEVIGMIIIFSGAQLNPEILYFVYFLLNLVSIPLFVCLWLIASSNMLSLSKGSKIILAILFIAYSIFYETMLFYFFFTDPVFFGTMEGMILVAWNDIFNYLLISYIIMILITGLLFSGKIIRSREKEIRLKGRFLLTAFITFTIGALIDALFSTDFELIIARIILSVASILFYCGFILPEWIKKIFIRDYESKE